jgi:hypothetical protein
MRACRPLEGASLLAVFEAAEKDKLAPLPPGCFELAEWRTAKVGPRYLRLGGPGAVLRPVAAHRHDP